ncbi:ADP-ribosylglycohydrolase family protein [Pseudomonas sp. P867]|uniref:ADP-ribosylglycohydrolase family protein n=1 Tax=Pseudomonas sp. P867 TaxID=2816050 RepID=UPI001CA6E28F|nr:ADP-ribosylglycohydrolase family protein [Pseudomonas sp. P867]
MNRLDRIKGCLLGDASDAPVVFREWNTIRAEFGPQGIIDFSPAYGISGAITDDKQMMLFTAEGLLRPYVRGSSRSICHVSGVMRSVWIPECRVF